MNIIDKLKHGLTTQTAEETRSAAEELAALLPPDCTLALSGDLGAGKTTFVQGLAKGWGIQKPVTSPTFNLYTFYEGKRNLIHFDAYRLNSAAQAEDLVIEDFLHSPYCLAVEWPENVEGWIPPPVLRLFFAITGREQHGIQLED